MEYIVLASGSKGNATILRSKKGIILIDLGISLTQFEKRAKPFNISLDDVDAIFYTHNHGDHFKPFAKLDELELYGTKEVAPTFSINEIHPYDELEIVGFKIKVIPLSHDANNTVGFIIEDEEDKLVYITDTGYLSEYNIKQASNATYYIFESNHDPELLLDTDRPFELKMRILSDNGHLSNEDSANYLCQMIGNRTKEVVLAHLSEEANTKELALNTFIKVAESKNINLDNIKVKAARQHRAISGGSL